MSPVARSQGHAGRALLVALAGVLAVLGVAAAISALDNRGKVEVRLGDDTFRVEDAAEQAEEIAENGPVLYSDVAGGDDDIYLQHLGDDPDTGWSAFAARPAGAPRGCVVEWQAEQEVFASPCTDEEFPADGRGLPAYDVTVEDGSVDVDLRS